MEGNRAEDAEKNDEELLKEEQDIKGLYGYFSKELEELYREKRELENEIKWLDIKTEEADENIIILKKLHEEQLDEHKENRDKIAKLEEDLKNSKIELEKSRKVKNQAIDDQSNKMKNWFVEIIDKNYFNTQEILCLQSEIEVLDKEKESVEDTEEFRLLYEQYSAVNSLLNQQKEDLSILESQLVILLSRLP